MVDEDTIAVSDEKPSMFTMVPGLFSPTTDDVGSVLKISHGKLVSFKFGDSYLVATSEVDTLTGDHHLALGKLNAASIVVVRVVVTWVSLHMPTIYYVFAPLSATRHDEDSDFDRRATFFKEGALCVRPNVDFAYYVY